LREQVYGRLETETDCSLFLFVLLITKKQKKERKKDEFIEREIETLTFHSSIPYATSSEIERERVVFLININW
jgi:hypothetical protein